MFVDFREVASGTEITSDICVLGGGAAGITVARTLGRAGRDVVLIESGGFEFDAATQDLYVGDSIGWPYTVPIGEARLRFFGGSTNHWAGFCGPLDPLDFDERPWVPYSGWPIERTDLDPYYLQAHELCELGPFDYDIATWSDAERRFPEFHASKLDMLFWQISPPTRFGERYREELSTARNIRVFLFANAVEIEPDGDARTVRRVHLRALGGGTGSVRANHFVLALGGIENPRLLLASHRVQTGGLGNGHDLVGRFFMEHPHVTSGLVLARGSPMTYEFQHAGVGFLAGMKPSPLAQRDNRILNAGMVLLDEREQFTGYDALRSIVWDVQRRRVPQNFRRHLWMMIRDFGETKRGLWSRIRGRSYDSPVEIVLRTTSEQAPNPASRITLGDRRDALGKRRVRLDWQLSPIDKASIRRAALVAGEEFGRLELGRVRLNDWLHDDDDTTWDHPGFGVGCHHMGTTRMATDPARGVVDADCRVHGIDNLYVAGSSVFSTSGFMNPTLTIVALALRLSDHLTRLPRP